MKKQYVPGAIVVLTLLCTLAQMMTAVVRNERFLPTELSGTAATIIYGKLFARSKSSLPRLLHCVGNSIMKNDLKNTLLKN